MRSTQSAPPFNEFLHDDSQPNSLHSGHGGARKKTRGRGRAKPKPKPEPKIEPVKYPFQHQYRPVPLPGAQESEAEIHKRGLVKAHSWVHSNYESIEYIRAEEKKQIMAQPKQKESGTMDFERLLEASGTFSRKQVNEEDNSTYSNTKPSSLDVTYGDTSVSLTSSADAFKNSTVLPEDFEDLDLPSNSAHNSPNVSFDNSIEEHCHDDVDVIDNYQNLEFAEYAAKKFEESMATAVVYQGQGEVLQGAAAYSQVEGATGYPQLEGAAAYPRPEDATTCSTVCPSVATQHNLYIDLSEEYDESPLSLSVPDQFRDADSDENVLDKPDEKNQKSVVKDCEYADEHTETEEKEMQDNISIEEDKDNTCVKEVVSVEDVTKDSGIKSPDPNDESSVFRHDDLSDDSNDDPLEPPEKPGHVVIRNVTACQESRDLIRDIVYSFGTVLDYVEQELGNGRLEITVKMRKLSEAEYLVQGVHGSDALIQDTVLEVEHITESVNS